MHRHFLVVLFCCIPGALALPAVSSGLVIKQGNLRQAPSLQGTIIGKLSVGDKVEVLDRSGAWFKIRLPEGTSGWASGALLRIEPAPAEAGAPPEATPNTGKAPPLEPKTREQLEAELTRWENEASAQVAEETKILRSGGNDEVQAAAERLSKVGAPAIGATRALLEALGKWRGGIVQNSVNGPMIGVDSATSAIIRALGSIGKPIVGQLVASITNPNKTLRYNSITVLARIKDPRAIEALIDSVQDENPYIKTNAAWALAEITGQDFGNDAEKWKEWLKKEKTE